MTAASGEAARHLDRLAATTPLFQAARPDQAGARMAWRIAPAAPVLDPPLAAGLAAIGPELRRFLEAADALYAASVAGEAPPWVHHLLERGKPAALVRRMREDAADRTGGAAIPRVIRPDIVVTEAGRLVACELDSIPGGIGFTAWMAREYARFGQPLLGGPDGLVHGFAAMVRAAAGRPITRLAIVVSDESDAYRAENAHLAKRLAECGLPACMVPPEALRFGPGGVGVVDPRTDAVCPVDAVYRFLELFDLPNVPAAFPLFDAARAGQIAVTPPCKPQLEEKLLFALYHHPALAGTWASLLPPATRSLLDGLLPETWLLEPANSPAPAPPPYPAGTPEADLRGLAATGNRHRPFVIKPSGFSPLAWGARGIVFGPALTNVHWAAALDRAVAAAATTPHILQRYHRPRTESAAYFDFQADAAVPFQARTRYSPYFYALDADTQLAGAMVTQCPLGRWALHGMSDAVIGPAALAP